MTMNNEQKRIFDIFTTKPAWMKEAVLTKRGWANPNTGEILLGRRTPEWVFEELAALEVEAQAPVETVEEEDTQTEVVTEIASEELAEVAVETQKPTKISRRKKSE